IFRPRGFTQDDSHIFCTPDQLQDEIHGVMDFLVEFYETFGLRDPLVHLSTVNPDAAIGTPEMWKTAEEALRVALDTSPFTDDVDANESMQYKVRRGAVAKIPWLLVTGPREIESGTVSVRTRDGEDKRGVPLDEFIASARAAVDTRALDV